MTPDIVPEAIHGGPLPLTTGSEPSGLERAEASFVERVAAVPLSQSDLSYLAVNVLHGTGSLSRENRRAAVVAIRTLQAIMLDAGELAALTGQQP